MNYCKNCRCFIPSKAELCRFCGSEDLRELPVHPDEADPDICAEIIGEKILFKESEYIVHRVIGMGGYGLILEVANMDSDRIFALKVPSVLLQFFNPVKDFSLKEIEESENSIKSEASVLNKIKSDRIIKVFDSGNAICYRDGEEKGFPAILMELAYCNLRDIILLEAEGKIEIATAEKLKMTSCIVKTIEDLHRSGIIHRDIALENIFAVNRKGNIEYVMADFGTSREQDKKKKEKTTGIIGRDKYIDPMRFNKKYRRDPRIDIFTAGIVITEIFIGNLWDNIIYEPLYDLDFEREFLNSYASGQINRRIVKFISKAIKSDITKRYKDSSEMRRKFDSTVSKMVRSAGCQKIVRNIDLVYNIPVPLKDPLAAENCTIDFENHKKMSLDINRKTVIRFGPEKIYKVNLRNVPFFRAGFEGREILIEPDRKRIERELKFFKTEKFREDRGILYFTGKLEIEIRTGMLYPEEMGRN